MNITTITTTTTTLRWLLRLLRRLLRLGLLSGGDCDYYDDYYDYYYDWCNEQWSDTFADNPRFICTTCHSKASVHPYVCPHGVGVVMCSLCASELPAATKPPPPADHSGDQPGDPGVICPHGGGVDMCSLCASELPLPAADHSDDSESV